MGMTTLQAWFQAALATCSAFSWALEILQEQCGYILATCLLVLDIKWYNETAPFFGLIDLG